MGNGMSPGRQLRAQDELYIELCDRLFRALPKSERATLSALDACVGERLSLTGRGAHLDPACYAQPDDEPPTPPSPSCDGLRLVVGEVA